MLFKHMDYIADAVVYLLVELTDFAQLLEGWAFVPLWQERLLPFVPSFVSFLGRGSAIAISSSLIFGFCCLHFRAFKGGLILVYGVSIWQANGISACKIYFWCISCGQWPCFRIELCLWLRGRTWLPLCKFRRVSRWRPSIVSSPHIFIINLARRISFADLFFDLAMRKSSF